MHQDDTAWLADFMPEIFADKRRIRRQYQQGLQDILLWHFNSVIHSHTYEGAYRRVKKKNSPYPIRSFFLMVLCNTLYSASIGLLFVPISALLPHHKKAARV